MWRSWAPNLWGQTLVGEGDREVGRCLGTRCTASGAGAWRPGPLDPREPWSREPGATWHVAIPGPCLGLWLGADDGDGGEEVGAGDGEAQRLQSQSWVAGFQAVNRIRLEGEQVGEHKTALTAWRNGVHWRFLDQRAGDAVALHHPGLNPLGTSLEVNQNTLKRPSACLQLG